MGFLILFYIFINLGTSAVKQANALNYNFNLYYTYLWGGDHFIKNPEGTEVLLKLDQNSGAGFKSKSDFWSGLFHIKMKIPAHKSDGVVTSFYLTSLPVGQNPEANHFEIDFEFLGSNGPLNTNIFDNDKGHREQVIKLWFNPSWDFHSYDILWNDHHIVFLVDDIPIREFKNYGAQGLAYPSGPMHVEASIWNADWIGKVNWTRAPFVAHYTDFAIYGCTGNVSKCSSPRYFWNKPSYLELDPGQKQKMKEYQRKYMIYDYCSNPSNRRKECDLN